MLLGLGDLTGDEIRARTTTAEVAASIAGLEADRRAIMRADCRRAALHRRRRCRTVSRRPWRAPAGRPARVAAEPVRDPLGDLARRFARTHAPFAAADFAVRYALGPAVVEAVLARLAIEGRLIEGEFRPGGTQREWTDANVLRMLRRRSLAKLRHEIEPVDPAALGRLTTTWQGIVKTRRGPDALLDAIEQLQGAPMPASLLETEILPARLDGYDPADLDAVTAAGEIVWVGVDARRARWTDRLYLADQLQRLLPPETDARRAGESEPPSPQLRRSAEALRGGGRTGPTSGARGPGPATQRPPANLKRLSHR